MEGRIFLLQGDGSLLRMNQQRYEAEELLQRLLERYPDLLAGDQIDSSSPRRFLLIDREVGVPGEDAGNDWWSLDHLFFDQDAVPTFVEVKRGDDTRSRREVVAQMLDYAANGTAYWPVERMRELFVARCTDRGLDSEGELAAFLGVDADHEAFWDQARTNLREGRIRLLFVADVIPPTLRSIVEFLNKQMNPAEVLAVEIPQFVGGDGTMRTLVPRVIGQLEATRELKTRQPYRPSQITDDETYFSVLPPDVHGVVRHVCDLAVSNGFVLERRITGTGSANTRLHVPGVPSPVITIAPDAVWISLGRSHPQLSESSINQSLRQDIQTMVPTHKTIRDPRKSEVMVRFDLLQTPEQFALLDRILATTFSAFSDGVH